jgi:hypothetical protein
LQEDVGRLQVAVDDTGLMGHVHGPRQDFDQLGRRGSRLRCAVELLGQPAGLHVLQGHVRPTVMFADVIYLHQVRMPQTGDHFCFGTKPRQLGGPGVCSGKDHLECNRAIQVLLPCQIDHTHAAATQLPFDPVARHGGQCSTDIHRIEELL